MRRAWVAVLVLIAMAGPVRAELAASSAVSPGLLCRVAVAAAERANGIPSHLLAAISRVETGRHDPVTDDVHPWPWTANAEGQGYFYDTKVQAVAAVHDMQVHGVRSIDVGCGQVNLMHHPGAFPSLDVAFDPQANAAYAAKFLKELFNQTGDWSRAVAMYHSATPGMGDEYRKQVLAAWPQESRPTGTVGASPLARAWQATLGSTASAGMIGPGSRTIRFSSIGGGGGVGRGLDAYRALPIRLAGRGPPPWMGK